MIANMKKFIRDESGPELVEWAVVTIILLVAAVLAYIAVGTELRNKVLGPIKDWLTCVAAGNTAGCPQGKQIGDT
jgi:Flp pilus assembly pilin Flp